MITLDGVTKYYGTPHGRHYVLRDVSMTVPLGRNIGVIGRNGAGKSTLLRLMAGVDYPNKGRIQRVGRYSWPLALAGRGVQGSMTGRENVIFAARIHGLWGDQIGTLVHRVERFSELGEFFDMEVNTYSSGMRARLSFSIAMLFDFDCYFIDELNAVGDARFRRLTREYFEKTRRTATFIQVSHDLKDLHKVCDAGILVNDGMATFYEYVDDAIAAYRGIVGDAGDFEEEEDEATETAPAAEAMPLAVPQTRQARRAAALARKRQRQRAAREPEAAAAAGGAEETAGQAADAGTAPRATRHRSRKRARRQAADTTAAAPTTAKVRPRVHRRRKAARRPPVVTLGLSPTQQIALQQKARRKGKPKPGGSTDA